MTTEAAGATELLPVVATLADATGPATVVTSTVTYDGLAPARLVAICDLDDGRRAVGLSDEAALASLAVDEELAGRAVTLEAGTLRLA